MTSTLKITILVILTLSVSMTSALADTNDIQSPHAQFESGVSIEEIQCRDDRVLMQSPSGLPACVFTSSVDPLKQRGFILSYETAPYERPVGSIDQTAPRTSSHTIPEVSISRLPNINETATVTINITNNGLPVTNTTENRSSIHLITGWTIPSGFEIVDSGGLEYEIELDRTGNEILRYYYTEFTPLDTDESKTYTIEVRAVNEGHYHITGISYYRTGGYLGIYLDDEETMLWSERMARYPELYPSLGQKSAKGTQSDSESWVDDEDWGDASWYVPPSLDLLTEFFAAYFEGIDPKQRVGESLDFVQQMSAHLNLNMTDFRQILRDGGHTDAEIDEEFSKRASTQSSSSRSHSTSFLVSTWVRNDQIPFGEGDTTYVNSAKVCIGIYNNSTGTASGIGCGNTSSNGVFLYSE